MTTAVEHARRELRLLGEDPAFAACLVATVAAFASFGHSGGSAEQAMHLLDRLLRREALTPLTADPDEWIDRSEMSGTPLWQSERDPSAFSTDGGRTYKVVGGAMVVDCVAPPAWVEQLREQHGLDEVEAVAAVWAYLDAGPLDAVDRVSLVFGAPGREEYLRSRWGERGSLVAVMLFSAWWGDEPAVLVEGQASAGS